MLNIFSYKNIGQTILLILDWLIHLMFLFNSFRKFESTKTESKFEDELDISKEIPEIGLEGYKINFQSILKIKPLTNSFYEYLKSEVNTGNIKKKYIKDLKFFKNLFHFISKLRIYQMIQQKVH